VVAWGASFWAHAVIRTRFFDDWLLGATDRGIRQVVLVAAGGFITPTRAEKTAGPFRPRQGLP
jgi:hypothetical protein